MNDFELYALLQELNKIVSQYRSGKQLSAQIQETAEQISTQCYRVAVVGEFNRGKSSLINALLGTRILPTDILPMTAAVTRVRYSTEQQIRICFKDGSQQLCSPEELDRYATKMNAQSEQIAASVREIEVSFPSVFLKHHFELMDTPGLNESERMSELTLQTIGNVDAAIVVLSPDSPLSMSEQQLALELLSQPEIHYLVFVVNKLDRIRKEEKKDRLLQEIEERITKVLLPQALEAGTAQAQKAGRILKEPAIFGVSAAQAMEAFERDDLDLLDESRFPDFKTDLLARLIAAQGENPRLRSAELIQKAAREVPRWLEAEQEGLDSWISRLETKLAAVQSYLETEGGGAAANLTQTYERLQKELHLTPQGLGEETNRLRRQLRRIFIGELCTVTLQNNTDAVIRSCLCRAGEQAYASMQSYRKSLFESAWQIFFKTTTEAFLNLREAAGLAGDSFEELLCSYAEAFPQFHWSTSPVPNTDNMVGKEVMPQVETALQEALALFEKESGKWTQDLGDLIQVKLKEDLQALQGQPEVLQEQLDQARALRAELGSTGQKHLAELAEIERTMRTKEEVG